MRYKPLLSASDNIPSQLKSFERGLGKTFSKVFSQPPEAKSKKNYLA